MAKFPDLMGKVKNTPTQIMTQIPTQNDTQTLDVKVRKDRRVQLMMETSLVKELDKYAKKHNTSRSELVQAIVKEYLKNNG